MRNTGKVKTKIVRVRIEKRVRLFEPVTINAIIDRLCLQHAEVQRSPFQFVCRDIPPRWPSAKAFASRVADLGSIPSFAWDLLFFRATSYQ